MEEIVNKIAESSLEVFDLEDYFPGEHVVELDISQWLLEGFILKEKEFRQQLKDFDWSIYQDKYVGITCSTDAILPAWTFALIAVYLKPIVLKVIHGTKEQVVEEWYKDILAKTDYSPFQDKPVILKGCSKKEVPQSVYTLAIQKLMPFARSIMFGEACSAVPLYKRTR
ncbi:DUF2480 family protein [Flavobacterium sp. NRK F10]|uniref:DUF2480 domain-containing protein n=1 Tax=Flavobacterium sediminis TaxID=2201181 RepID=A0A2U8QU07_9FLAO|nr:MULTISPECIES: DUF2480 family protein [Flavobacterium]AWM13571.1 hypothetical protein DI487_06655 [Flavobacterium sediminis]MCO6174695.1 DUF2480 family protein [Flavobacterium sp. NRK F10]